MVSLQDNAITKNMLNNYVGLKPSDRAFLKQLNKITQKSNVSRQIYYIYIGFLVYCTLTVVSTSDQQIILNNAITTLPILNLDVSLNCFFILSPIIAIFIFIYLHWYLQDIQNIVKKKSNTYTHFKRKWQRMLNEFFAFWALPLFLLINAFYFSKKHAPIASYIIGAISIWGTLTVIYFWCNTYNYKNNLLGGITTKPSCMERIKQEFREIFKVEKELVACIIIVFVILSIFINCSNRGEFRLSNVDLSRQILITEQNPDYKDIYWQDLNGAHLEGANLSCAVLKRADLGKAYLQKANLKGAKP